MCCLYRNPDLDGWIFDCLLASMAAMQAEDIRASFLFVESFSKVNRNTVCGALQDLPMHNN